MIKNPQCDLQSWYCIYTELWHASRTPIDVAVATQTAVKH